MTNPLRDKALHVKVEALLARMTLAEKIGQMAQAESSTCSPGQAAQYHLGAILSGAGTSPGDNKPEDWVKCNDAYWQAMMTDHPNRLAIPLLFGIDAIHGNNNVSGATVFPHNIGLGAAGDTELVARIARITAKELLATGLDWTFAPNLAVAQDVRWGRTYESFAQSPELISQYAGPIVRALQDGFSDEGVLACIKHWVGDGGTEHGIDHGNTVITASELNKTHITPFRHGLDAGALVVMTSFSSWNGDKCHGHKHLIEVVLKQQLKFDGMVVSDWNGIDYLTTDFFRSVALGVNAGIDMFMVPDNWLAFIEHLQTHVEMGTVAMERINDAVRRILRVKFACGLFDKGRPAHRPFANSDQYGSQAHREVAREAVRKSLVLLKNQQNLLPLDKTARILVAGRNANNTGYQCGGFTIGWQGVSGNDAILGGTSVWQGIQAQAPNAQLSKIGLGHDADPAKHDVAIVVIGEAPYAEGQGDIRDADDIIVQAGSQIEGQVKVLECYGDSLELNRLHPDDLHTIHNIAEKGIPVVTIMVSGRPLVVNQELQASDAFVAAWLPGSEGQGVSDVLFGDYDFQGKLTFDWPQHADWQPGDEALFSQGYGLSYRNGKTQSNKGKGLSRFFRAKA